MSQTRQRRPMPPNLMEALNSNKGVYTNIVWHFALEVLAPAYVYDLTVGQWVEILDGWAMSHRHLSVEELPWKQAQPQTARAGSAAVRRTGTLGSPAERPPHMNEREVGSKEEMMAAIKPEAHLPEDRRRASHATFSLPQVDAPASPKPDVQVTQAVDAERYFPLGHREDPYDPAAEGDRFRQMYGDQAHKRTAPEPTNLEHTAVPGAVRPISVNDEDQSLERTSVQVPVLAEELLQGASEGQAATPTPRDPLATTMESADQTSSSGGGVGDTAVMSALADEDLKR